MTTEHHFLPKPSSFHPSPAMAQFTTRESVKPPFDTEVKARPRLDQKCVLLCYDKFGSLARNKPEPMTCVKNTFFVHLFRVVCTCPWIRYNSESSPGFDLDADYDGVYEVLYDDNFEFRKDDLDCFRSGLVLDVSYRPINAICWRRAISLEFHENVDVYDRTVNSSTASFYIHAVLRIPHLLIVVKGRRMKNILSRKNVLYRDDYKDSLSAEDCALADY